MKFIFITFIFLLAGCYSCVSKKSVEEVITTNADNPIIKTDTVESRTEEPIIEPDQVDYLSIETDYDTIVSSLVDTIRVELVASFSTGKIWAIEQKAKDDSIEVVNKGQSNNILDGKVQDLQYFDLLPKTTGQFELEFVNKRPFGKDKGILKILKQTLIIK